LTLAVALWLENDDPVELADIEDDTCARFETLGVVDDDTDAARVGESRDELEEDTEATMDRDGAFELVEVWEMIARAEAVLEGSSL
jgi:hypothetical protein